MIFFFPVNALQALMRWSVASDPEEQKRTRSAQGTIPQTRRASSSWCSVSKTEA
jgi:hypothetical protein